MGFFSSLLGSIAPIAGALLGVPQAPRPVAAAPAPLAVIPVAATSIAPTVARTVLQSVATGAETAVATRGGGIQAADRAALARVIGPTREATGGGKNRVQTEVLTIAPNGTIVNAQILEGRPWLMRKDFVIMKRVLRTLSAGNKRVPRKVTRSRQQAEELAMVKGIVKGLIGSRPNVQVIDTD